MQQLAGGVIVRAPAILQVQRMSAVAYPFYVLPLAVGFGTCVPCDRTFSEVSTHLDLQLVDLE